MSSPNKRSMFLLILLLVSSVCADAAPETAFSNADVVKLVKLDLGDDVVIAKVKQAETIAFDLTPDALVQLKLAGVSGKVIAAMLDRATPRTPVAVAPPVEDFGQDVRIVVNNKETRLPGNRGDISATGMWPVIMTFLDYPGLHARMRTTEARPTLLIRSEHDPTGYYYIGKLDVNDEDDNNRSLKIEQKASGFSATTRVVPAGHWQVEYTAEETSAGIWRVIPKRDLRPGEYGVVVPGGILFEFGVD